MNSRNLEWICQPQSIFWWFFSYGVALDWCIQPYFESAAFSPYCYSFVSMTIWMIVKLAMWEYWSCWSSAFYYSSPYSVPHLHHPHGHFLDFDLHLHHFDSIPLHRPRRLLCRSLDAHHLAPNQYFWLIYRLSFSAWTAPDWSRPQCLFEKESQISQSIALSIQDFPWNLQNWH